MSRFRRMAHNVASSYASLAVASLFNLATVPVALHYLDNDHDRFALWLLMSTITGYMSLIDLGMSSSVARLLIDYKDRKVGSEYGSMVKTGWLVLLVQAVIILSAGIGLAPLLATLLKIDTNLRAEFIRLLCWQSASLALSFALRIFSHILRAHQRSDLENQAQVSGFLLNFGLMWWFFRAGCGVFSLAWATILTNLYGGLFCWIAAGRLGLLPRRGAWGNFCGTRFRELFNYGQAVFWVCLGTQMILASQILIIQRTLGSGAATFWGLGTRMFSLVLQLIRRVFDNAGPALAEMMTRQEVQVLQNRYREIVIVTTSLGGFCAVGFALCNGDFVFIWTRGQIVWPLVNSLGLAAWIIIMAGLHCHNSLVLWTKQIASMPYVYVAEGVVFVITALLLAKRGGIPAIICCSIVCSCLFSGAYGIWRTSEYFQIPKRQIVFQWSRLMARTVMLCVLIAVPIWLVGQRIPDARVRLAIYLACYGSLGTIIFLRYGLPATFQTELVTRAPRSSVRLLRRILAT